VAFPALASFPLHRLCQQLQLEVVSGELCDTGENGRPFRRESYTLYEFPVIRSEPRFQRNALQSSSSRP
jgi:hypothetical protein